MVHAWRRERGRGPDARAGSCRFARGFAGTARRLARRSGALRGAPRRGAIYLRVLAALWPLAVASGAGAQSVVDGTDAAIGPEDARVVVALIGRQLRSADARVTELRRGRAGVICGAVEVRNRMGTYTGPRGFAADLADGFAGRLPEGPELRNPSSAADYRAMERARSLFVENCIGG